MENTELKKTFMFGYSRNSVQDMISNLKLTNQKLMDKLEMQEGVIETLKEKLLRYESKDVLVSEVLVEAKHVAKKMVKEAHEEVNALRSDSEKEMKTIMSDFDQSIVALEIIKSDIINQEELLKEELKALLKKYLAYVDSINLTRFTELTHETNLSFQAITEIKNNMTETTVEKAREVVVNNKVLEFQSKSKKVELAEDSIPTYEFSELIP